MKNVGSANVINPWVTIGPIDFSLDRTRLPDGTHKRSLLRVIDRSRSALPLRSVLRVIRLKDCGWRPADFTALGEEVQRHNPYRHPLSIPR